jgi:hypothetical protein
MLCLFVLRSNPSIYKVAYRAPVPIQPNEERTNLRVMGNCLSGDKPSVLEDLSTPADIVVRIHGPGHFGQGQVCRQREP